MERTVFNSNGNTEEIFWTPLGKDITLSNLAEKTLFGTFCNGCNNGDYPAFEIRYLRGEHIVQNEQSNQNKFYLLFKFPDKSIDTLKVNTLEILSPYSTEITFSLNNEVLIAQPVVNLESELYITLQK